MSVNKWVIKPATIVFIVAIASASILVCIFTIQFTQVNVANVYASLALLLYGLSLMPSNGATLVLLNRFPFNTNSFLNFLVKLRRYRRQIGVASFCFSLKHGVVIFSQQAPSWPPNLSLYGIFWQYWHGLTLMGIMLLLTITSNNWSVKSLGKYWHSIHRLTYPMAFLILYHIVDKMGIKWTFLTPISMLIGVFILSLLIYRLLSYYLCFDYPTIAYCKKVLREKSNKRGET